MAARPRSSSSALPHALEGQSSSPDVVGCFIVACRHFPIATNIIWCWEWDPLRDGLLRYPMRIKREGIEKKGDREEDVVYR